MSVVTCVNNFAQYESHVVQTLQANVFAGRLQLLPIDNRGNPYSAAQALNLGLEQATADIVVLCHQDVMFPKAWLQRLFACLEVMPTNWGVAGTGGVRADGTPGGAVQRLDGSWDCLSRWQIPCMAVQTLDEHCLVLRKSTPLRFDEKTCDGFHFYGADICLAALQRHLSVQAIYNPLIHNGGGTSLLSGKAEFQRQQQKFLQKWTPHFSTIHTPTCRLYDGKLTNLIDFA